MLLISSLMQLVSRLPNFFTLIKRYLKGQASPSALGRISAPAPEPLNSTPHLQVEPQQAKLWWLVRMSMQQLLVWTRRGTSPQRCVGSFPGRAGLVLGLQAVNNSCRAEQAEINSSMSFEVPASLLHIGGNKGNGEYALYAHHLA